MKSRTVFPILAVAACVAAHASGLKFDITSDHEDATYKLGEQAVFTVKALDASGAPAKSGRVKWNLNNFGAKVFASGTEDLSANGGTFTVKGAQTEPGFLRLDVTEVGKKPSSAKWGVAFEPKKIVPGTPYPDDFMDFWRSAIAKYDREVTEPIRVTEVKRTAASVMYELRIPSTQGRYVWGYFSEPVDKTKGPFPLQVSVPGAGPSSWGCTMDGNSMHLKVNVHYYDPAVLKGEPHKSAKCLAVQREEDQAYAKKYPVKTVRYTQCGIAASREDYFYYGVILAANRAVDWAASRPGVDPKRVRADPHGPQQAHPPGVHRGAGDHGPARRPGVVARGRLAAPHRRAAAREPRGGHEERAVLLRRELRAPDRRPGRFRGGLHRHRLSAACGLRRLQRVPVEEEGDLRLDRLGT